MVFHSSFPSITPPTNSVVEFIFENRNNIPEDQPVFVDSHSDRIITFGQFKQSVLRFGGGLVSYCNLKPADVISANPAYTVTELVHQLKTSGAKLIVCSVENMKSAVEAGQQCGIDKQHIFLFGDQEVEGIRPYSDILNKGTPLNAPVKIAQPENEVAYMCFSSGTSGLSKGVCSTHTNITSNILQCNALLGTHLERGKDRVLGVLPFFHIFGLVVVIHYSLFMGIPVVVVSKFDLVHFCETVQKQKVTFSCLVPPILVLLAKHPLISKYDLSSLRKIMCGAAPLSAELADEVAARLPGTLVTQGYGLTETSPVLTISPFHAIRGGSSGLLVPNVTIKLVNEEGKEVGVGERGELWCKGPNIMQGYTKNPKATAECIDEEGYFHTGDVAVVDKDGYFYIVDRIKELIKYKGFQVAPAELESLLLTSPIVADCAVIGIYDTAQATEVPRAYIVLKDGVEKNETTSKAIQKFVADQVIHYKQVRSVVFIDVIPKSPSGKILRRVLRDEANKENNKNTPSKL
ncbi:hypothetical protein BJ944DRAFT_166362 [Cunninghamella echinulata]|nr:hypothetical protein BJ944DRAFT_166362 [Cunninghamella echinulata]